MKKSLFVLAILVAGSALTAKADDNCIMKDSIEGFSNATDTSIVVSTGPSTTYLVTTMGYCDGLSFANDVGFQSWGGDDMEICQGDSLVVPSEIGPDTCVIQSITPVTSN